MKHLLFALLVTTAVAGMVVAGCAQATPAPAPTKAAEPTKAAPPAPTKPPEATKPAAPAAAPTKAPEATKPAAAAPTAAPAPAKKVNFPAGKPITIIVPFAAGGAVTVSTRIISTGMEKELGTTIENVARPGASTQVGVTELANSKPDGYTLVAFSIPTSVISYMDADRKATYARKDLQPVAGLTIDPTVIAVKADSPYKTLKDLVDAAKAKPEQVKIATSGLMAGPHLASVVFADMAGAKFAFVHFDGGAPATTAVLGGHTDAVTTTIGSVNPYLVSGQLRALGVMGREESEFTPGVKTFKAQGYDIDGTVVMCLVLPAGTPKEIADVLSGSMKVALANDDVKKRMREAGQLARFIDTTELTTIWNDAEVWIARGLKLAK